MTPNTAAFKTPRRARRAGPSCRGGASSLLRLAQPAAPVLPASGEVDECHERVLDWLTADSDWPVGESHASIITRLVPSHELNAR